MRLSSVEAELVQLRKNITEGGLLELLTALQKQIVESEFLTVVFPACH